MSLENKCTSKSISSFQHKINHGKTSVAGKSHHLCHIFPLTVHLKTTGVCGMLTKASGSNILKIRTDSHLFHNTAESDPPTPCRSCQATLRTAKKGLFTCITISFLHILCLYSVGLKYFLFQWQWLLSDKIAFQNCIPEFFFSLLSVCIYLINQGKFRVKFQYNI